MDTLLSVDCGTGMQLVRPMTAPEEQTHQQSQAAAQAAQAALAAALLAAQQQARPHGVRVCAASTMYGAGDYMVVMTGAGQTVTLPSAAGREGARYAVKNAAVKNTTLVAPAPQTIDGKATYVVGSEYAAVALISDGANWLTC